MLVERYVIGEHAGEKRHRIAPLHLSERVGDFVPKQHGRRAVEERNQLSDGPLICPVAQDEDPLVLLAARLARLAH